MTIKDAFREVKIKNKEARVRKGEASELKVHSALDTLIDSGRIITWWRANWRQDVIEKTDVIIMATNGNQLEMQIKTAKKQANIFRKSHPEKLTIDVPEDEDVADLGMRIFGIITKKLKEGN